MTPHAVFLAANSFGVKLPSEACGLQEVVQALADGGRPPRPRIDARRAGAARARRRAAHPARAGKSCAGWPEAVRTTRSAALGVTERTMKNHVSRILAEPGMRDRTRAVLKALEKHLL